MSDASSGTVAASAQPGGWNEPFRGYLFKLILDGGTDAAHFTSVTGLGMDVEVIEYREAGAHSIVRQLPGRVSFSPVRLTYGLTRDTDMIQWMVTAESGQVRRRQVSIAMLDLTGSEEVLRWNLRDAWPKKWEGSLLDSLGNAAAIEAITIVHEGFQRADTSPTPPTPAPAPPAG
jgi:phage tail-like protein